MNKKKILAVVLAVVILCSVFPFSAFAAVLPPITIEIPKENTHPITVNFTYEQPEQGKITITGYDSKLDTFDGTLYIPNNYKNCVVSSVSDSAFKDNKEITELIVDENIKTIGAKAFYGCTSLEKITLSEGLEYINDYAFYNCKKVKELVLPDSLQEAGFGMLQGCNELKKLTLPFTGKSRTKSTNLTYFYGDKYGDSAGYYTCSVTELIFSENCTAIPLKAAYGCNYLKKVTIPKTVTRIKDSAFYKCYNLENVIIPSGVTTLESTAFYDCSSMENVFIPDSVTSIGSRNFYIYTYTYVPSSVVINCYEGSYAQTYAVNNGFNYKLLTRYDASGDDILDTEDLAVMKKYILGNGTATFQADCNYDGTVDLLDFIKIKKHFATQVA